MSDYPDMTPLFDEGERDRAAGKPLREDRDLWDPRERQAYERGWWSINDADGASL